MERQALVRKYYKEWCSIDLAKFVFAFSVIFIHAGGGTITQPVFSSLVNAFNSLAVPFFFIAAGFFFFGRIDSLDNPSQKRGYVKKYLLKTIRIYFIWSVALLPSRIILSDSNLIVTIIKWIRVFLFIGDAQLWYLNALIVGLLLILLLQKAGLSDKSIITLSTALFIAGIFVQKRLDASEATGYIGVWKLYYFIWGNTVKNGFLMGMFYCMIGKVIPRLNVIKMKSLLIAILFGVYAVGVYYQFSWRTIILPIISLLVFMLILDVEVDLKIGGKWLRSMSTLLFLSHYIFVRLLECVPILTSYFLAGIYKYLFVTTLTFALSAILVFVGNKNSKVRYLWQ